jgi:transposase
MVESRTKRDFDGLSERRREGMTLLEDGMSQSDVARELRVSRQTVSRWAKLKDEFPDEDAWRRRPLGRPGGMTGEQRMALVRVLVDSYLRSSGSQHRSSRRPVRWTLARVAGLIEAESGFAYSPMHVRNILAGLVGDGQWLLSRPRFWACIIELAYPEYAGQALVEDFEEGWKLNGRVIADLLRRSRP